MNLELARVTSLDLFPVELAAAQAEYHAPPPFCARCEVDGCGGFALPFSTFCADCDELPDYQFSDLELYGDLEPPRDRDPVLTGAFFDYVNQR